MYDQAMAASFPKQPVWYDGKLVCQPVLQWEQGVWYTAQAGTASVVELKMLYNFEIDQILKQYAPHWCEPMTFETRNGAPLTLLVLHSQASSDV